MVWHKPYTFIQHKKNLYQAYEEKKVYIDNNKSLQKKEVYLVKFHKKHNPRLTIYFSELELNNNQELNWIYYKLVPIIAQNKLNFI